MFLAKCFLDFRISGRFHFMELVAWESKNAKATAGEFGIHFLQLRQLYCSVLSERCCIDNEDDLFTIVIKIDRRPFDVAMGKLINRVLRLNYKE